MLFKYKGYNINGVTVEGYIEAENRKNALYRLKTEENLVALTYIKKKMDNPTVNRARKEYEDLSKKVNMVVNNPEKKAEAARKKKDAKAERARKKADKAAKKAVKRQQQEATFLSGNIGNVISSIFKKKEKKTEVTWQDVFLKDDEEQDFRGFFEPEDDDVVISKSSKAPKIFNKKDLNTGKEVDWGIVDDNVDEEILKKTRKLKTKERDVILFTRRLSIMLASGVSLMRGLAVLRDSSPKKLQSVIDGLMHAIEQGNSLSQALARYPNQFDYTYIALVSIGETSGSLEQCLNDIIYFKEKNMKIRKKVKTAAIYPSIIGGLLGAVMVLGSIYFIPMFEEMFTDQGLELPALTSLVFAVADYVPWTVGTLMAAVIGSAVLRKRNKMFDLAFRRVFDLWMMRIPVVKNVLNASYMFTFSSTIALMLQNGIRIKDALSLAQRTIANVYIKSEIGRTSELMVQGMSFSEALSRQPHFDTLLTSVALTGEESGKMSASLKDISIYYDDDLNRYVDNLMEMVQPVSILAIGLIAVPVIISIYLPILSISSGATLGI